MLEINHLTESLIGCAIEVHRQLGPGLLEGTYESAYCIELDDTGRKYKRSLCRLYIREELLASID